MVRRRAIIDVYAVLVERRRVRFALNRAVWWVGAR
jgi:hypothetical protein